MILLINGDVPEVHAGSCATLTSHLVHNRKVMNILKFLSRSYTQMLAAVNGRQRRCARVMRTRPRDTYICWYAFLSQYLLARFVACGGGWQLERRLLSSTSRGSNGKWQTKARLCSVTDGVGRTGKQRGPTNGCGEMDCEGCCEWGGGAGEGYCGCGSHARSLISQAFPLIKLLPTDWQRSPGLCGVEGGARQKWWMIPESFRFYFEFQNSSEPSVCVNE